MTMSLTPTLARRAVRERIAARDHAGAIAAARTAASVLLAAEPAWAGREGIRSLGANLEDVGVLALARPELGSRLLLRLVREDASGEQSRLVDHRDALADPSSYASIGWATFIAGSLRTPRFERPASGAGVSAFVRDSTAILLPLAAGHARRDRREIARAIRIASRRATSARVSILAFAIAEGARRRGIPVGVKKYDVRP